MRNSNLFLDKWGGGEGLAGEFQPKYINSRWELFIKLGEVNEGLWASFLICGVGEGRGKMFPRVSFNAASLALCF